MMFSVDESHDVMAVEIIGRAFLWHQVGMDVCVHKRRFDVL